MRKEVEHCRVGSGNLRPLLDAAREEAEVHKVGGSRPQPAIGGQRAMLGAMHCSGSLCRCRSACLRELRPGSHGCTQKYAGSCVALESHAARPLSVLCVPRPGHAG